MNKMEFNLAGFDKVDIKGDFDFEVTYAEVFSVSVQIPWFKHVSVYESGGRLTVSHPWYDVTGWFTPWMRPQLNIHMPALSELRISGASRGSATGFSSAGDLRITVQGASVLKGDLAADTSELRVEGASNTDIALKANSLTLKLLGASRFGGTLDAQVGDIEVAGASRLQLKGTMGEARLNVAGASRLDLQNLSVHNANVRLVGASSSTIKLDGKLDAELAGASRLVYDGNPAMGRISTVGASSLTRK